MSTATLDPPVDMEDALHWDAEFEASAADPAYFVDQYGVIDKPKAPKSEGEAFADELDTEGGTEGGTVRFRLWPAQVAVMGTIATERKSIILKARQLGISWLVCGYVLWLCLFFTNQSIFLFSKRQKDADELIRRIKALYARLPGELRDRLPKISGKNNVREIEWSNGSKIQSMPDTKDSGVGNTASLVVLDEWARMRYGATLFEQISPVMEAGGQMIILSTANGFGNCMHDLWDKAVKGLNSFRTIFLPWWYRPGRTKTWYATRLADSNDTNKFKENYPANPVEAFRASGSTRFHPDWVQAQAKNLRDPLPQHQWPGVLRGVPGLKVYKLPDPSRRYFIPADVAEGKETSNYDAAPVLDRETLEEVAFIHGQWEPEVFALWLIALSEAYNGAKIIPERNNHGHAVILTIKLKGYLDRVGLGHDGSPGWLTNAQTKPLGIDILAEFLRKELITVRSLAALIEFSVYKKLKNGTTGAEAPYFDDIVMSWYVGLSWLRHISSQPEAARPEVGGVPTRPTGFLPAPSNLGFPGVRR